MPDYPVGRLIHVAQRRMTDALRRDDSRRRREDVAAAHRPPPPESDPATGHDVIFNEGYLTGSGERLARTDLSAEAIRLTRIVHLAVPGDPEVGGLLALMLLSEARPPARADIGGTLAGHRLGGDRRPVRTARAHVAQPDGVPDRAIAAAMVDGPAAGLALVDQLQQPLCGHHRLHAVRGHLREMAGGPQAAIADYQAAASRTTSLPERHCLLTRAAALKR